MTYDTKSLVTGLHAVNILGISITSDPKEKILEEVRKYLKNPSAISRQPSEKQTKPLVIVTPNPEQVVEAQQNGEFRTILNQADVKLPDGIGIVVAARLLQSKIKNQKSKVRIQRIPGVEFMGDLVKIAAKEGIPIGLIGGRDKIAVRTLECLQRRYSGLKGWAEDGPEIRVKQESGNMKYESRKDKTKQSSYHASYFMLHTSNEEDYFQNIAMRIIESGTYIVFVGLGAPKQEYVIDRITYHVLRIKKNMTRGTPLILMSVGGAFDMIAGSVPRAPHVMRSLGVEWLWRLVREPWRWRRHMALLTFLRLVISDLRSEIYADWVGLNR